MIPSNLDRWSITTVQNLLAQGYYESEYLDFKEMLPVRRDDEEKSRLHKTCCAFANSDGGFLIFGVKDGKKGESIDKRLVGMDPNFDFPEQFGPYPAKCNPSVMWNFKNPPLRLDSGNIIHIVHIPRSWTAPHCLEISAKGSDKLRCFPKRTNKGNEDMSYEEIRLSFLQYYEKRLKLQLLMAELQNIGDIALKASQSDSRIGDFSLTVLETTLADTYTILATNQELLDMLTQIRNSCMAANNHLREYYAAFTSTLMNRDRLMMGAENRVQNECRTISISCQRTMLLLKDFLAIP